MLLGAGAGAAYYFYKRHQEGNIRGSSSVEFVTTAVPEKPVKHEQGIDWPMYGYDEQRTHVAPSALRPPYRRLWWFGARSLLEFPPAVGHGRLYFTSNAGVTFAVGAHNGGRAWRHPSGRCVASSPALSGRLVFQAFLNKHPCNATGSGLNGQLAAYYVGSGKTRWSRTIGPSETSPLVEGGHVYVGDWNGDVWAFNGNTGRVAWKYHTGGKVKGGIAYAAGRLYVGSYDHHVYCLRARDGKLIWRASAQERLGSAANFYSDSCGRLRPGLHRRHGRQGLLLRRNEREAPLVARHGRLRVLLSGGMEAARLRRLVQREPLRVRRGDRRCPLDVRRARPDFRVADGPERDRLLRHAGQAHVRPGCPHGQVGLDVPRRPVLAGRGRPYARLPGRARARLRLGSEAETLGSRP